MGREQKQEQQNEATGQNRSTLTAGGSFFSGLIGSSSESLSSDSAKTQNRYYGVNTCHNRIN